jgi:2-polyprenyl-3-methyl-5-hydroxy-6-metoxy-1,4-benzoquinol methylase
MPQGLRSFYRGVRTRAVSGLMGFASSLGDSNFVRITKRPRSLSCSGRTELLPLRYTYRANSDGVVKFNVLVPGSNVRFLLHAIDFSSGAGRIGDLGLACEIPSIDPGDVITVDLTGSRISINNSAIKVNHSQPLNCRKFVSEIQQFTAGRRLSRLCSHYLPYENKPVGADYYFGDDYVDYTRTSPVAALALVRSFAAQGRLLDVGCALGIYSKAFLDAGFDVYATDISEFAIARASVLLGPERTSRRDLDIEGVPFEGFFDTIWMWDVVEHFSSPEAVLAKISSRSRTNALLFLHTSNGNSLTHRVFGADWEGYSDYSHRSVDQVTASTLRGWLGRLGWEIIDWECDGVWAEGFDPVLITLKEVFETTPELRVFLKEMELCDAIRVVARKK